MKSIKPIRNPGRPRVHSETAANSLMRVWLDNTALPKLGMTNKALASFLGYTRPHIISMWRTGDARVPLSKVPVLAELFSVDISFVHFLWSEQETANDNGLVPIETMLFESLSRANQSAVLDVRAMQRQLP